MKNYMIEPGYFMLDGGAMFGIIPKPLWQKVHPADELNRIDLALRLWLIKTKDKNILVDTGIGDYHGETFDQRFNVRGGNSPLKEALNEVGLKPEDITDLIISHLHFDHVGGIAEYKDGEIHAVLPNARCHVHKKHFDYSLSPTDRDAGSFHVKHFKPILDFYESKGNLIFHEGEQGSLFELEDGEELKFMTSHGHTPWLLHPYSKDYIYMADLIPTSNHVSIPWVMGYDISPGITTEDKKRFLPFIKDQNLTMIFEHDPKLWGAKVTVNEKGRIVVTEPKEVIKKKAYLLETGPV